MKCHNGGLYHVYLIYAILDKLLKQQEPDSKLDGNTP